MTSYCYKCQSFDTEKRRCHKGQKGIFIGGMKGCWFGNPVFRSEIDCQAEAYFEGGDKKVTE